ncbi:stage II sporulation protein R [Lutibacter sp. B2]|nr:stage II sporulation protein R [Lutibacter sp. B2]
MNRVKKKCIIGVLFIALISMSCLYFTKDVYENQKSYKDQLIRFHVLANSDSPKDQALKLKVRDRIINEMNPKFEASSSLEESKEMITENIPGLEKIAREEIIGNGYDYDVKIALGDFPFPTKNYGSITLPAGNYQALRVEIGEAEGANWWCVLFPPLCFVDMKNGLTDERTKQEMQNVLTKEEFNMINTASSEDKMPIKLKFKIVEVFEGMKEKMNHVVGMQ